ncbi:MAG: hypothetical protein HY592_06300, partial [Candidatus Omnitrophica bacterium]|nr:hypothetical protein [Candidatus Omnitrophota bacterium]
GASLGMTSGASLGMTSGASLGMTSGASLGMTSEASLGMTSEASLGMTRYVFLEAGYGNQSLSFLRPYLPLAKRKIVAESYLRRGKLQGAEYADLTQEHDFVLWGVEDMELYRQALETYRSVAKNRERFEDYLNRVEATVKVLKSRIYNPTLLLFDRTHEKFEKEEIALSDYFEILFRQASERGLPLSDYPHLKALNKLKALESQIDFQEATRQAESAMAFLSPQDQKELMGKKQAEPLNSFKDQTQKAFFALLEEKINSRADYPQLVRYFHYLKKARSIDLQKILLEQKSLENRIYESLAVDSDEAMLIKASRNAQTLKKLLKLTLTPDEFAAYRAEAKDFDIQRLTGFLNKKIMDLKQFYEDVVFLESGYEDVVQKCESFYELTYHRDQKFIENALRKMESGQTVSILITGGYHSPNLKHLLKRQNISYIVFTPQILHETNLKRYEDLLLSQHVAKDFSAASTVNRLQHLAQSMMSVGPQGQMPWGPQEAGKFLSDFAPKGLALGARMSLTKAGRELFEWKRQNADSLNGGSERAFWTSLQTEARRIYEEHRINEWGLEDRLAFVREAFDAETFPAENAILDSILTTELLASGLSILDPRSPAQYHDLQNRLVNTTGQHSRLVNRNVREAINLIFDLHNREKRILEQLYLVQEIDKEIAQEGSGRFPVVAALQDLHGGARFLRLAAYLMGLRDPRVYNSIATLESLQRALDQDGIDPSKADLVIAGLNDMPDRGMNFAEVFRVTRWLAQIGCGRFFVGNHDLWRVNGALMIPWFFSKALGVDLNSAANKNDHIGFWGKDAWEHEGWGVIEIERINQKRLNREIDRVNAVLPDTSKLSPVDLMAIRKQYEAELIAVKRRNSVIRQENISRGTEPDYVEKKMDQLPDVKGIVADHMDDRVREYTERVASSGVKKLIFHFEPVTLDNYWLAPEVLEPTLWVLQNFRIFYVSIYGDIHQHNLYPMDQGGVSVEYKGLRGLPALERMADEVEAYFRNYTVDSLRSELKAQDNAIRQKEARGEKPGREDFTFTRPMWEAIGAVLEEMNGWYTDHAEKAVAKSPFIHRFLSNEGLMGSAGLGIFDQITGQTTIDREPWGDIFVGHNEKTKLHKDGIAPTYLYPQIGRALTHVDNEISEGYQELGGFATTFIRDVDGRLTGRVMWGYRHNGNGREGERDREESIEDITFDDVEHMNPLQRYLLQVWHDGDSYMRWYRLRALQMIADDVSRLGRAADYRAFWHSIQKRRGNEWAGDPEQQILEALSTGRGDIARQVYQAYQSKLGASMPADRFSLMLDAIESVEGARMAIFHKPEEGIAAQSARRRFLQNALGNLQDSLSNGGAGIPSFRDVESWLHDVENVGIDLNFTELIERGWQLLEQIKRSNAGSLIPSFQGALDALVRFHDSHHFRLLNKLTDFGGSAYTKEKFLRAAVENRPIYAVMIDYDACLADRKTPISDEMRKTLLSYLRQGRYLVVISGNQAERLHEYMRLTPLEAAAYHDQIYYFGEQGGQVGCYDAKGNLITRNLVYLNESHKDTIVKAIRTVLHNEGLSGYLESGIKVETNEQSRVVIRINQEGLRPLRFDLSDKIEKELAKTSLAEEVARDSSEHDFLIDHDGELSEQMRKIILPLKERAARRGISVVAGGSRSIDISIFTKREAAETALGIINYIQEIKNERRISFKDVAGIGDSENDDHLEEILQNPEEEGISIFAGTMDRERIAHYSPLLARKAVYTRTPGPEGVAHAIRLITGRSYFFLGAVSLVSIKEESRRLRYLHSVLKQRHERGNDILFGMFDVDGTLNQRKDLLTLEMKKAILDFLASGRRIAFTSGMSPKEIHDILSFKFAADEWKKYHDKILILAELGGALGFYDASGQLHSLNIFPELTSQDRYDIEAVIRNNIFNGLTFQGATLEDIEKRRIGEILIENDPSKKTIMYIRIPSESTSALNEDDLKKLTEKEKRTLRPLLKTGGYTFRLLRIPIAERLQSKLPGLKVLAAGTRTVDISRSDKGVATLMALHVFNQLHARQPAQNYVQAVQEIVQRAGKRLSDGRAFRPTGRDPIGLKNTIVVDDSFNGIAMLALSEVLALYSGPDPRLPGIPKKAMDLPQPGWTGSRFLLSLLADKFSLKQPARLAGTDNVLAKHQQWLSGIMRQAGFTDFRSVYDEILKLIRNDGAQGRPATVFFSGVPGSAKTTSLLWWAENLKRDLPADVDTIHFDDFELEPVDLDHDPLGIEARQRFMSGDRASLTDWMEKEMRQKGFRPFELTDQGLRPTENAMKKADLESYTRLIEALLSKKPEMRPLEEFLVPVFNTWDRSKIRIRLRGGVYELVLRHRNEVIAKIEYSENSRDYSLKYYRRSGAGYDPVDRENDYPFRTRQRQLGLSVRALEGDPSTAVLSLRGKEMYLRHPSGGASGAVEYRQGLRVPVLEGDRARQLFLLYPPSASSVFLIEGIFSTYPLSQSARVPTMRSPTAVLQFESPSAMIDLYHLLQRYYEESEWRLIWPSPPEYVHFRSVLNQEYRSQISQSALPGVFRVINWGLADLMAYQFFNQQITAEPPNGDFSGQFEDFTRLMDHINRKALRVEIDFLTRIMDEEGVNHFQRPLVFLQAMSFPRSPLREVLYWFIGSVLEDGFSGKKSWEDYWNNARDIFGDRFPSIFEDRARPRAVFEEIIRTLFSEESAGARLALGLSAPEHGPTGIDWAIRDGWGKKTEIPEDLFEKALDRVEAFFNRNESARELYRREIHRLQTLRGRGIGHYLIYPDTPIFSPRKISGIVVNGVRSYSFGHYSGKHRAVYVAGGLFDRLKNRMNDPQSTAEEHQDAENQLTALIAVQLALLANASHGAVHEMERAIAGDSPSGVGSKVDDTVRFAVQEDLDAIPKMVKTTVLADPDVVRVQLGGGFEEFLLTADLVRSLRLEEAFGKDAREGSVYSLVNNRENMFFAKFNDAAQTLMIEPLFEISPNEGDLIFSEILAYAALMIEKRAGKGLIVTINKADGFKSQFLNDADTQQRVGSPNVRERAINLGMMEGVQTWYGGGLNVPVDFQFEYNYADGQRMGRPMLLTAIPNERIGVSAGFHAIIQPSYTVAIVGFGTIGSRVHRARALGFKVVAVQRSPSSNAQTAQHLGVPLYVLDEEKIGTFNQERIKVEGWFQGDLLEKGLVDVIVDATNPPKKMAKGQSTPAEELKERLYDKYAVRVIYQGGEDPGIAEEFFDITTVRTLGVSFDQFQRAKSLFCPSCNTTAQGMVVDPIANAVEEGSLTIDALTDRRASDPGSAEPSVVPDGKLLDTDYHHAEDWEVGRMGTPLVKAFKEGSTGIIEYGTDASGSHITKFHLTQMVVRALNKDGTPFTADDALRILSQEKRIALIYYPKHRVNTSMLIDVTANSQIVDVLVPIVQVVPRRDGSVGITIVNPQETVVIPNNINAIQAMTGVFSPSIAYDLTNAIVGIDAIRGHIEGSVMFTSARVDDAKPSGDSGQEEAHAGARLAARGSSVMDLLAAALEKRPLPPQAAGGLTEKGRKLRRWAETNHYHIIGRSLRDLSRSFDLTPGNVHPVLKEHHILTRGKTTRNPSKRYADKQKGIIENWGISRDGALELYIRFGKLFKYSATELSGLEWIAAGRENVESVKMLQSIQDGLVFLVTFSGDREPYQIHFGDARRTLFAFRPRARIIARRSAEQIKSDRRALLDALEQSARPLTPKTLALITGLPEKTIRNDLSLAGELKRHPMNALAYSVASAARLAAKREEKLSTAKVFYPTAGNILEKLPPKDETVDGARLAGEETGASSQKPVVRIQENPISGSGGRPAEIASSPHFLAKAGAGARNDDGYRQSAANGAPAGVHRFFAGLAAVFSLAGLDGRALALEAPRSESSRPMVFRITVQDSRLVATAASGFRFEIDVREIKKNGRPKEGGAGLGVSEIGLVQKTTDFRVRELLSEIDSSRPVIVNFNAQILPQEANTFYAARLATAAMRLKADNIHLTPVGPLPAVSDNQAFLSESEVKRALQNGARLAYLTLSDQWDPEAVNIPVQPLTAGDVPDYESAARLAAAGARLGDAPLTDGFREVWSLLAGLKETIDPQEARQVMEGRASRSLAARLSIKPLLHTLLNHVLRSFEMIRKQFLQAA